MANDRMLLIQEEPRGPSYLIEIPLSAADNGRSLITWPIIQDLVSDTVQQIVIKSIRLITFAEKPIGPTTGLTNAPLTELLKMNILFYAEGWQKGYLIPLLSLNNTYIEGSGIPWRDKTTKLQNWGDVNWNKVKFQLDNGTSVVGAPYCIIVEVEYERFDNLGNVIKGPNVG